MITNKINDKIYIGETLNTIEKRFYQHCRDAYNKHCWNYYFYRAIRKYGKDNFEIIELEQVKDSNRKTLKIKILELEEKYILEYDSFNLGYNSNSGGRHPLQVSQRTKDLQRKRKLENPNTLENLKYASSFLHTEKGVTAYNYLSGDVIKKFNSIREASEYYSIDRSGITKVCKGKTNYLGTINDIKITWRYSGDSYEVPYIVKVYNESGELLNRFVSFADAARFYNIKYQETIVRCCNGKIKNTGRKPGEKLIWRFINDNFNL